MELPQILTGISLTRLLQGAAAGAAVTAIVGFNWGGWMLASTANTKIAAAEQAGAVRVLAPICVDKFQHATDVVANLKALNATDSWKRDEMIEKAGWTTFPGSEPTRSVAAACLSMLPGITK